jgi:predicted protein tyrosine phosphatase
MRKGEIGRIKQVHPYAWLWEPLEADPTFLLGAMFGSKVVYLDSRLVLCFAAKSEPWRGMLVCMERQHHAQLMAEFPSLLAHAILPKWLYLSESADDFERVAQQLVELVKKRDPRIGIAPKPEKRARF